MSRARRPRTVLRPLLAAVLALVTAVAGVLGPAGSAPAQEVIVDLGSTTELEVSPGDRTEPGIELMLTATVAIDVSPPDELPPEGTVDFFVGSNPIARAVPVESGRAQVTVTPPQGAHILRAHYWPRITGLPENVGVLPSSDRVPHSVLPDACPDEAQPGSGAVVRHAYLVALRRCPDAAGYRYWVDRLDAGTPSGTVASTLARSAEAVDVVVDDAYRRILGRPADPAGRHVWAAKLRTGWATSQLWAALAAAPEFAAGTDGPAALVARAFDRIVDRPADPAGAAYWQARLAGGPPSSTWRALAVTAEVLDGIVADAHQSALGRAASPSEADAARATIRSRRGDWRLLVAELLGRPEATTHAQRYPDPETGD